jgi:hypothetical protein
MRDVSDFGRGQIVVAHFTGAYMTKTATLLGVLRVTVSKVMSAYMNHGKTVSARGRVGENKHWQKENVCTLRRIISKNHRTAAAQVNCSRTEYSS